MTKSGWSLTYATICRNLCFFMFSHMMSTIPQSKSRFAQFLVFEPGRFSHVFCITQVHFSDQHIQIRRKLYFSEPRNNLRTVSKTIFSKLVEFHQVFVESTHKRIFPHGILCELTRLICSLVEITFLNFSRFSPVRS